MISLEEEDKKHILNYTKEVFLQYQINAKSSSSKVGNSHDSDNEYESISTSGESGLSTPTSKPFFHEPID